MKLQIRILLYSILFFVYLMSTSVLLTLDSTLKINKVYITLGCGFTLINLLYSFLVLKWTPLFNILCAIIIGALSLFLALKFGDLHLFSNYDPYDIKTAILANAIFSILFWEIVYQIKNKKSKNIT